MSTTEDQPRPNEPQNRLGWWTWTRMIVASFALAVCTGAYLIRTDLMYALTIWPAWAVGFAGLSFSAVLLLKTPWAVRGPILAGWLLLALGSEEWRTATRFGEWPSAEWIAARKEGRALRIVSLNCAGGISAAAEEVVKLKPDIVLLQESPDQKVVEGIREDLFGSGGHASPGPDGSVVVSRTGTTSLVRINATGAEWEGPSGLKVLVVSARLTPPIFRMDYWNPSCWSDYSGNRRFRRQEVRELVGALKGYEVPMIFGGDLNSPPDGGIFGPLSDLGLTDSFAAAGRGWGATGTNDYPLVRIDQIWLSKHFEPAAVYAIKTENSDHQMVVCDVFVRE